jgi:hypothetical protein
MTDEPIANKFRGKGKTGLFCPFRQGHYCNKNCGLFCEGLGSCVFHAINLNLQNLDKKVKEKK